MIAITLNFTTLDAALRALREIPENSLIQSSAAPVEVSKPLTAVQAVEALQGHHNKKDAAEKKQEAKAEKAAPKEEPKPEPAAAAEPPATVEYPVLQKAVFALAGKSREAAAEVAASFGAKTFKDLPEAKWGDALAAVQAKLAELEGA